MNFAEIERALKMKLRKLIAMLLSICMPVCSLPYAGANNNSDIDLVGKLFIQTTRTYGSETKPEEVGEYTPFVYFTSSTSGIFFYNRLSFSLTFRRRATKKRYSKNFYFDYTHKTVKQGWTAQGKQWHRRQKKTH